MARPLQRDIFAWFCTIPASTLLIVCLFLPQFKDCNGDLRTPFDTNTAPMMIGLALIGLLPLLWRWRWIRNPAAHLVLIGAACVLVISVIGVAVAIMLALARRRHTDEEIVALSCFSLLLVFIFIFPLAGMFGTWLWGAWLTWAASWFELVGMIVWTSAASARPPITGFARRALPLHQATQGHGAGRVARSDR